MTADVKYDPVEGKWYVELDGEFGGYFHNKTEAIEQANVNTPKSEKVRVYELKGGQHVVEFEHDGIGNRDPYGEFGLLGDK